MSNAAGQGRAGPEFIWNTLDVTGPHEPLHAFLAAASGPGFIDWQPEWYSTYEQIYFGLMAADPPPPSKLAAERLARKLADRFWRLHGAAVRAAELDPHRLPLDLNALIPIPDAVLRKGFLPAGQSWMQAHWGVAWPLRKVSFAMEHRRRGAALASVAVFRFVTEDWSPWLAIAQLREQWPDLRFQLTPSYLEPVAPDGRARRAQRVPRANAANRRHAAHRGALAACQP